MAQYFVALPTLTSRMVVWCDVLTLNEDKMCVLVELDEGYVLFEVDCPPKLGIKLHQMVQVISNDPHARELHLAQPRERSLKIHARKYVQNQDLKGLATSQVRKHFQNAASARSFDEPASTSLMLGGFGGSCWG